MRPYVPKTNEAVEQMLAKKGFDRDADVVPSLQGVPEPTGLSGEDWVRESGKFFEDDELGSAELAALLDDLKG